MGLNHGPSAHLLCDPDLDKFLSLSGLSVLIYKMGVIVVPTLWDCCKNHINHVAMSTVGPLRLAAICYDYYYCVN